MVTVQFNFKTILEAQEFLAGMTNTVSGPDQSPIKLLHPAEAVSGCMQVPAEELALMKYKIDEANAALDVVVEAKKKRGPKPKAVPVKEYGIEDCRRALSNLFDVKGREVAKSVLTEFKADRINSLPEDVYGAFIERCKAAGEPE